MLLSEREIEFPFPISRDSPEGGTTTTDEKDTSCFIDWSFQFLGIPPKGEPEFLAERWGAKYIYLFPISRDPPEGGTSLQETQRVKYFTFPISRDPPEGGTWINGRVADTALAFPISRDPPEGGTPASQPDPSILRVFPISRDPPEGGT